MIDQVRSVIHAVTPSNTYLNLHFRLVSWRVLNSVETYNSWLCTQCVIYYTTTCFTSIHLYILLQDYKPITYFFRNIHSEIHRVQRSQQPDSRIHSCHTAISVRPRNHWTGTSDEKCVNHMGLWFWFYWYRCLLHGKWCSLVMHWIYYKI